MPEAENMGQPAEKALQQDHLVEQLMSDPAQGHPDVRTLIGFLGRSTQKGYVRLYLSTNLDMYVEIPEDAIIHRQSISNGQTSITGTMLWIKADTIIEQCVRTSIHLRQAAFLGGNLSTDASAIAGLQGAARAANFVSTNPFNTFCWINSNLCQPVTILDCQIASILCEVAEMQPPVPQPPEPPVGPME